MKIIHQLKEMQRDTALHRSEGKSVGLIPTMGALHEGHLSLIRAARQENDRVVVSIFVNPTQFGANEDFDLYPRNLVTDAKLAEESGADVIFNPSAKDMYPSDLCTSITMGSIAEGLCGRYRPGHFDGVAIVVNKLFNLVNPHRAYFGQKDAQQVQVIRKMAEDLNMGVEIVACPIIREADGLAMSSRNVYLKPEERISARLLSQALREGQEWVKKDLQDPEVLREKLRQILESDPAIQVQYIEIVHPESLHPLKNLEKPILIALAVFIGSTRLIDNIIIT